MFINRAIVLETYLKIGDRVMSLVTDKNAFTYPSADCEGATGTVIGFYRSRVFIPRNNRTTYVELSSESTDVVLKEPGEYVVDTLPVVQWDKKFNPKNDVTPISASAIAFLDYRVFKERINKEYFASKTHYQPSFRKSFPLTYVGPLPKTKYIEGNVVELTEKAAEEYGGEKVTIISIEYGKVGELCSDGVSEYPIYQAEFYLPKAKTSSIIFINDSDIESLYSEGNYQRLEENKTLIFHNTEEVAKFYLSLGEAVQLKNPKTGYFMWKVEDVINHVKEFPCECFYVPDSISKATGRDFSVSLYSFPKLCIFEEFTKLLFQKLC